MDQKEALQRLGIDSAGKESVQAAHRDKRAALEAKRERAPTDTLWKKFDSLIEQLDQARDVLLAGQDDPAPASSQGGRSPLSQTKLADLPQSQTAFDQGGQAGSGVQLAPGTLLAGRYEIQERIGEGGMGAVFRAHDRNRQQDIALKVLLPALLRNQRARERFLDEARLSSQLSHPHIVNVHDVQQDGDLFFLTMELLEGQDLRQVMENRQVARQSFSEKELIEVARTLCGALDYAHQHTVHRDIKPENIWVTEQGEYKLMDFGIARAQSNSQRTQTGAAMGTAYYMAPEQLKGQVQIDGRADQYAVAVMLYELATGDVPAGVIKPLREKRKDLSKGFAAAVMKALQAEPDDRHADMAAFVEALQGKGGGFSLPDLPWPHIGIAAGVLIAVLGLGALVSSGTLDLGGLLPDPQAEDRALALDGELATLSQRLDSRQRAFSQQRDDVERQVDNLERDLRNADGGQRQQLQADLESARTQLREAEQIVEFGRQGIFESELYTRAAARRRVGEQRLRNGDHGDAASALGEAKNHFATLLARVEALPDVVRLRGEAQQLRGDWEELVSVSNIQGSQLAKDIAGLYQSADDRVFAGQFDEGRDQYRKAVATIETATEIIRQRLPQAREQQRAWQEAAAAAGLQEGRVAQRIADRYAGAESSVVEGDLQQAGELLRQANTLAADAEAFAKAKSSGTVDDVVSYRQDYPEGVYSSETDAAAWENASGQDSIAAYNAYLEHFPEGAKTGDARERVDKLAAADAAAEQRARDNAAWQEALAAGTVSAIEDYARRFPNGIHGDEVAAAKDDAAWSQALSADTVAAIETYREQYPNGRHSDEVTQAKNDLDDQVWEEAVDAGTIKALDQYRERFPKGRHIGRLPLARTAASWKQASYQRFEPPKPITGYGLSVSDNISYAVIDSAFETGRDTWTATLWNLRDNKQWTLWNDWTRLGPTAFSPDERFMLVSSYYHGWVQMWDTRTRKRVFTVGENLARDVADLAFSPNGNLFIVGYGHEKGGQDYELSARVFDTASGDEILELDDHNDDIDHAGFFPSGRLIYTMTRDDIIRLWDAENGKLIREISVPQTYGTTEQVVISPNGRWIFASATNARIWDAESGRLVTEIEGALDTPVAFSTDGEKLLMDGLWDVESGKRIIEMEKGGRPMALSPDGGLVVSAGLTEGGEFGRNRKLALFVCSSSTGEVLAKLTGFETDDDYGLDDGFVHFSTDGKRIVTNVGLDDGVLHVWTAKDID